MNEENDIPKLAEAAFESGNFELAYKYFNKYLEKEVDNPDYWLKKGLCATKLSKIDRMLAKEITLSLTSFFQYQQLDESVLEKIMDDFANTIFDKILEGNEFISDEMNRKFNLLQMPAGTVSAVDRLRRITIQAEVGKKYKNKLFEYFVVLDFIIRKKPTIVGCEKAYRAIHYTNAVSEHNGDFFYSLEANDPESLFLKELLLYSEKELNRLSPHNAVTNPTSKSGCFVATATMGSYNDPIVVDLRNFRDDWLLQRKWGVKWTNWYYKQGPKAAKKIEGSRILKMLSCFLIVKPLHLITKLFHYGKENELP